MTTMAERRQLLIEIDRTFKLIAEGLESFDEKLEAMKAAPNKQQKEKHMAELKEELKKLQRYRAKVMTWTTCKEVKDKRAEFEDQRLIIETRMETYREMERADKTKPFSEKALEAEPKIDPIQRDRDEVFHWLRHTISILQTQTEPWEAELERMTAESSGGRSILVKIEDLRLRISQNQQHVGKLELIMRFLHNDSIDIQDVKDLRETVEAYVDSQRESRYAVDIDYLDIYDDILESARENDQLLLPLAQAQGALNTAASIDDVEEETHEASLNHHHYHHRPSSTEPIVPPYIPPPPKQRSSIPIPNYSIEDHGSSHSHSHAHTHHTNKFCSKSMSLSSQSVVPAPVPPPLSVPYSQVAAVKVQQQTELEYFDLCEEVLSRRDREELAISPVNGTGPAPTISSQESSDEESSCSVSSAQKEASPVDQVSVASLQKLTGSPDACFADQADEYVKTPSALLADLKISIDGNYSSTDDMLALVCDPEKLNLIARQTTPAELVESGDQDKRAFTRVLPSSLQGMVPLSIDISSQAKPTAHSINDTYLGDRGGNDLKVSFSASPYVPAPASYESPLKTPIAQSAGQASSSPSASRLSKLSYANGSISQNGGSFRPIQTEIEMQPKLSSSYMPSGAFKMPISVSSYAPSPVPSALPYDSPLAAPPMSAVPTPPPTTSMRISRLPYAFNGAVNHNGGSDADGAFRKEEVLKMMESSSKRLPHPDSSMRSGHRRLWREQNFHGSINPNYPIQQSFNFCGIDLSSRMYYSMLTDETLFFVFYYLQGTLAHRYSIECLEERGWMWHVQRMQWFKHETADLVALRQQVESLDKKNGFVAGSFKYFDYEKWEERLAPPDFVFRLEFWKTLYPVENSSRRFQIWMKSDKAMGKENSL